MSTSEVVTSLEELQEFLLLGCSRFVFVSTEDSSDDIVYRTNGILDLVWTQFGGACSNGNGYRMFSPVVDLVYCGQARPETIYSEMVKKAYDPCNLKVGVEAYKELCEASEAYIMLSKDTLTPLKINAIRKHFDNELLFTEEFQDVYLKTNEESLPKVPPNFIDVLNVTKEDLDAIPF